MKLRCKVPRTHDTPRFGFVKFIHHLEILILKLLKMPNQQKSLYDCFLPSCALNIFVQAGHLTEPS